MKELQAEVIAIGIPNYMPLRKLPHVAINGRHMAPIDDSEPSRRAAAVRAMEVAHAELPMRFSAREHGVALYADAQRVMIRIVADRGNIEMLSLAIPSPKPYDIADGVIRLATHLDWFVSFLQLQAIIQMLDSLRFDPDDLTRPIALVPSYWICE